MMRISGFIGLMMIVGMTIAATICSEPAKSQDDRRQADSADEQVLRQSAKEFVDAFNKHDAKALAAMYTEDSEFVQQDGTTIRGRSAIEGGFADYFEDNSKMAISLEIDKLRFLTPDVAVEEGATVFFPDGETESIKGRYSVLHVKKDGKWLMAYTRSHEDEIVSNFSFLNDLGWLLGEWVDEGSDAIVETSFRWGEGKNFILGDFSMVSAGGVALKGTQRIGWDPEAKLIRSWIFDTEGGFAEAVWTQIGDEWVVKSKGVRKDGTNISFTRRFRPLSKDRVSVISTDSVSGNQLQPDFRLTMVRKQPAPKG